MMMGSMFWFLLIFVGCGLVMMFLLGQTSQRDDDEVRKEKRKGITKSAVEIADERYAVGDISQEEYNEILNDLEGYSHSYRLLDR